MNITIVTSSIRKLADALVKGSTFAPMKKTDVMPVKPFMNLFCSWPDNVSLSTRDLCMKAVCLLSLTFMLRPSDIAPRSIVHTCTGNQFSDKQVSFLGDGGLSISFHGIKNDYNRDGFTVSLPPGDEEFAQVDPIRCLKCYMSRTDSI